MRTFQEFQKEWQTAHDCEKCNNKIILISFDGFNQHCGYCGVLVHYPKATNEELISWMEEKNDSNLDKLIKKLKQNE